MGQYVRLLKMVQTKIPCVIQTGFTVFLRHLISWTTTLGTRSSLAMSASTATRKRRLHHWRPFRGPFFYQGNSPEQRGGANCSSALVPFFPLLIPRLFSVDRLNADVEALLQVLGVLQLPDAGRRRQGRQSLLHPRGGDRRNQ